MSDDSFDPYAQWLGIVADRRPPTHYDLLGLAEFESDLELIRMQAAERYAVVHKYQAGPRMEHAVRLLAELAAARDCLTDLRRKAEYDAALRAQRPPLAHARPPLPADGGVAVVKETDSVMAAAPTQRRDTTWDSWTPVRVLPTPVAGQPTTTPISPPNVPVRANKGTPTPLNTWTERGARADTHDDEADEPLPPLWDELVRVFRPRLLRLVRRFRRQMARPEVRLPTISVLVGCILFFWVMYLVLNRPEPRGMGVWDRESEPDAGSWATYRSVPGLPENYRPAENQDSTRSAPKSNRGAGSHTSRSKSGLHTPPAPDMAAPREGGLPTDVPAAGSRLPESNRVAEEPVAPERFTTNSIGMRFVLIPAGQFMMGSPDTDPLAFTNESPQHGVRIGRAFYLAVHEVTQGQYELVMGSNPSKFQGDPSRPVDRVSWDDAVEFCRRLSEREGSQYRLPTEAEWEYACRAGATTRWCFGDEESSLEDYAWFDNPTSPTHRVGTKKPNPWGLYDMHGSVWEWCEDVWHDDYRGAPQDGSAWLQTEDPSMRVLRGGSWHEGGRYARCATRVPNRTFGHFDYFGFRVARTL